MSLQVQLRQVIESFHNVNVNNWEPDQGWIVFYVLDETEPVWFDSDIPFHEFYIIKEMGQYNFIVSYDVVNEYFSPDAIIDGLSSDITNIPDTDSGLVMVYKFTNREVLL